MPLANSVRIYRAELVEALIGIGPYVTTRLLMHRIQALDTHVGADNESLVLVQPMSLFS